MTRSAHSQVLDILCPMHLVVGKTGTILHVGPTLRKLRPDDTYPNTSFFDHFAVMRPKMIHSIEDMQWQSGMTMHLCFRQDPSSTFKAVMAPFGETAEIFVINLSFGITIQESVRRFNLTNADFAATDMAMEMLYLIEAKSSAMSATHRLNLKLQIAKIAAEEQAFTDTLTGLKNRRAVDHVLGRLVESAQGFAVMQVDLDFFKNVNDTHGHAAGDHVLQAAARIMVNETRAEDTVARVGGDEFTLILPNLHDAKDLQAVGERLINRLERPIMFHGRQCRISASIGTVWIRPNKNLAAKDILSYADTALYQSKNTGRARQTVLENTGSDRL